MPGDDCAAGGRGTPLPLGPNNQSLSPMNIGLGARMPSVE